jgi:sulfur carrier protein ThiS
MKLTFKLYASLTQYLPSGSEGHQVDIQVPEGTTPIQVLGQYGVPIAQIHLVLRNGVFVPPSEREHALEEGDELAVWPAVAGG